MNSSSKDKVKKIDKNIKEKAKSIRRNNLIILIVIIITAIAIYFSYQIFSKLLMEKIVDSAKSNRREIKR